MSFDVNRIPDHIMHSAVREVLSDCKLSGGNGSNPYNFRCPICGDSKKNPHKKRGFILFNEGKWVYTCHNECGTMSFLNFLKKYHPQTFREVIFHAFDKRKSIKYKKQEEESQKNFKGKDVYKFKKGELISILDNNPTSKNALKYCKSRKIRRIVYSKFFVCLKDNKFLNRTSDGKYIYNDNGIPTGNEYGNRLIIPYYRYGGSWVQFDARDLSEHSWLRYRNLEGAEREIYNIDFLNINEPFFLFEGSIDSTFVRNSIAFGGTKHLEKFLQENPQIVENSHNGTVIWDNDNAGYDEMPKTTKMGFNWFDWNDVTIAPEFKYKEDGQLRVLKDMNDAVLYSDSFEFDKNGFLKYECLKKYIRDAKGSKIKLRLLYGNREKQHKERVKKQFDKMKQRQKSTDIKPYF